MFALKTDFWWLRQRWTCDHGQQFRRGSEQMPQ